MGRGVALQFKNVFPANFRAYAAACERQEVQPGRMFVFETGQVTLPRFIINFPTKRHWRGKSRIEDIDAGLTALKQEIRNRGIHSIAIPPLGSGLGGLDWAEVRSRIESSLGDLEGVRVIVFEPHDGKTEVVANPSRDVPKMTPGRAALVELMNRYLAGLLDPFVTLLEVHKLMYFLQAAGEDLRLKYAKAPYGPYAENLRHVLKDVEGHLISGYADGGDAPSKQLQLVPGALDDAQRFLEGRSSTLAHLESVSRLVEGFESPFGLELLSTVHWIVTREGAGSVGEVIEKTYAWSDRKRRFTPRQIQLSLRVLARDGWIGPLDGRSAQ
jgi:O-acetyl-ADP-ribose deacetylase (regulator of RNase III)